MANCSRCRCRRASANSPAVSAGSEPAVRRWPHPIENRAPERGEDPSLRYIRCALSYQNQLLSEIKSLLEELVENLPENESNQPAK